MSDLFREKNSNGIGPIAVDEEGIFFGSSVEYQYKYVYVLDDKNPDYNHHAIDERDPSFKQRKTEWIDESPVEFVRNNLFRIISHKKREWIND